MIFKSTLIKAARAAGKFQLRHFGKLRHVARHYKAHHEMVTYVDKQSERIIIKTIRGTFPSHAVISEESSVQNSAKSQYTWVIDPLDGTTNFAIGNPVFGISIGVLDARGSYEGVLYFPVMDRLLYCLRGRGAYENGSRIHVSRNAMDDAILTVNFAHKVEIFRRAMIVMRELRPQVNNVRVIGSSAFSFSAVAKGAMDALVMVGHQHHWDIHPGMLMVTEAGGQISNFAGKPWSFKDTGVIISNKKIHSHLVRELR